MQESRPGVRVDRHFQPMETSSIEFDSDYFAAKRDTVLHRSGRTHPYVSIDAKFCGLTIVPIGADGYTTLVCHYRCRP